MSSKYWLKLYHETLHDPKMQRLSDRLYRRTIEMLLFAGETDDDGFLPELDDIAWVVRCTPEEVESDLIELQRVGIMALQAGRWMVRNFVKRQGPMSDAERKRRQRVGERSGRSEPSDVGEEDDAAPTGDGESQSGHGAVTSRDPDTDTDRESDSDPEEESEQQHVVAALAELKVDPEMASRIAEWAGAGELVKWSRQGVAKGRIRDAAAWCVDWWKHRRGAPTWYEPDPDDPAVRRRYAESVERYRDD